MKKLIYKIFLFYWWIFRPHTYGIKVLLKHGNKILLISNSYDIYSKWNIPGGGYNNKKETKEKACVREIREELGINIQLNKLTHIGEYYSEAEYKKDHVNIYLYELSLDFNLSQIKTNYEIKSFIFFTKEEIVNLQVFKIVKYAIALLK